MDAGAELLAEKRGLRLDRVVLLGRTFEEYRRYFLLKPEELIARDVLDMAGGVSSFCAEANGQHTRDFVRSDLSVVSRRNRGALRARSRSGLPRHWERSHLSLELLQDSGTHARVSAVRLFRFCVRLQNPPERYVAGELPSLPFPDGSFDLTLVSYFLFAYQERLTCEFHRDSILELMRVTRSEACIYPTITFEAQPSQYIPLPRSDPALQHFQFTELKTDFEFLMNSNSFLRMWPRLNAALQWPKE